jgi:hypothetical protein
MPGGNQNLEMVTRTDMQTHLDGPIPMRLVHMATVTMAIMIEATPGHMVMGTVRMDTRLLGR